MKMALVNKPVDSMSKGLEEAMRYEGDDISY
jgi:hypothetical protein